METCLDEGTLQAYLDGELSPETSTAAAAHLSTCAACAEAASAAEQELAFFSTAFAPALSASVPTEKLRARLDEAIAEINAPQRGFANAETPAASRLRGFFDSLVASLTTFTPRQATAFASFLVAVLLVVVFALMQTPGDTDEARQIARVTETPTAAPVAPATTQTDSNPAQGGDQVAVRTQGVESNTAAPARDTSATSPRGGFDGRTPRILRARGERGGAAQVSDTTANTTVAANTNAANRAAAAPSAEPVLEDEKTYLRSIASLTSAIEAQGAEGMAPTLRAEYERNLAVVNQAIVSSRVAARRNPQDTDAKDFLRAAYQNKVELLSAIADQTQLASARD
ncbi:MAG TPA: zf-HC2 domain-containing protein [Pyrinomonadaceae bacterium]|nr:zf-HC2 domain-containing protein [Pyrinomonadaceae bacterium]